MKCDYFKNAACYSCELLGESYADSIRIKEAQLRSFFPNQTALIKPSVTLSEVTGSRNKAKLAVFSGENALQFGFYQRDRIPRIIENCPLHAPKLNALLPNIRDILNKFAIIPYDVFTKKGELKYLLISTNSSGDQLLLRFVLRSKASLYLLKKACSHLLSLSASIKVITANIQPTHQAIIEGDEEIVLTKESVILHTFDEFQLALGARSFFQVTPEIAKSLYNVVSAKLAADRPRSLLDLYCGVGAFSFYASRHCTDIVGIEISNEAIECARYSNKLNNVNINFHAVDAEKYLLTLKRKFSAILVNPPRRGLNSSIIEAIKKHRPDFLYYSSCNVQTLAKDYQALSDRYQIKDLQLFDMFPFTKHYETLICLVLK